MKWGHGEFDRLRHTSTPLQRPEVESLAVNSVVTGSRYHNPTNTIYHSPINGPFASFPTPQDSTLTLAYTIGRWTLKAATTVATVASLSGLRNPHQLLVEV